MFIICQWNLNKAEYIPIHTHTHIYIYTYICMVASVKKEGRKCDTVYPLRMNLQRCECVCPWMSAVTLTVLFKVLYWNVKNIYFVLVYLLCTYYLCEKYYKPITIQNYIADGVSWVPRLTLLDLMIKLDLINGFSEQNSSLCRGLYVYICMYICLPS